MKPELISTRVVGASLLVLAVIAAMWVAADFLKPVALAVLLAFVIEPLVQAMIKRGVPRLASVIVALFVIFSALGVTGYVVSQQLVTLADELPAYEANIKAKMAVFKLNARSPLSKVNEVAERVEETLDEPAEPTTKVEVVDRERPFERFRSMLEPFHIVVEWGGIVLLLLFFLLLNLDDLKDRIVRLVGRSRVGVTTKTLAEIAQRLSRYLTAFSVFNVINGVIVGLGLWALGLPFAVLWGFLAVILRFIPYVGPAIAFILPSVFAIAHFDGWMRPALVIGLYIAWEIVLNSIEPFVYGKSIGVTSLGMLVSALFWTWLWGPLGLLLATPLTVCLAVIGQFVPGLHFLSILLREEVEIDDDMKLYQRLLRRDTDGALAVLEESLEKRNGEEPVFDFVIIPALSRAEQDRSRAALDEDDVRFIWSFTRDWIDELSERAPAGRGPDNDAGQELMSAEPPAPPKTIVGVAAESEADGLVVLMVRHALARAGFEMQVCSTEGTPLTIAERVAELEPDLVLLSHLPPMGITRARYLIKRLGSTLGSVPLVFGYWEAGADPTAISEQMRSVAANRTVLTVSTAVETIAGLISPRSGATEMLAAPPREKVELA